MFQRLRSVTFGLVAAGVITSIPFSWYTSEAGMGTPELKWPTPNFTRSPTNLLATETPSFGSARSSPTKTWIFCPRMPPAALMSATACSTPFLSCAPKAALPPVIGPATPSLICAEAPSAKARPRPRARPSVSQCFIVFTSGWERGKARLVREPFLARFNLQTKEMSLGFWRIRGRRIVAAAPAKWPRALMDPFVAGDHLGGAREVKAERPKREADRVIDEIIMQRQELAVEQGEVEEAHGKAQRQHVERKMPPRPPGPRDRPPREPRRAAAHAHAHQEKNAERMLVGQ